jgi:cell division protein FtsB
MTESETPVTVPAQRASRKISAALALIFIAVALVLGIVIGAASAAGGTGKLTAQVSSLQSDKSALQSSNKALQGQIDSLAAEKTAVDAEKAKLDAATATLDANTFAGDGTFVVGTDIQPGTYRSSASPSCYWARLSGLDGSVDSIIANDNTDGPVVVTIAPTDKAFTDARCGSFTKIG